MQNIFWGAYTCSVSYDLLRKYIIEGIRFMSMYLLYFIHTYMPDTIKMTYEYLFHFNRPFQFYTLLIRLHK